MHVIRLVPDLTQYALKVRAHLSPRRFKHLENPLGDHRTSIFWYKDQVSVKAKYYVSSPAKLACA